jgi:hypothetical protein
MNLVFRAFIRDKTSIVVRAKPTLELFFTLSIDGSIYGLPATVLGGVLWRAPNLSLCVL